MPPRLGRTRFSPMTRKTYAAVAGVAALIAAGLIGASLVGARAEESPPAAAPSRAETTFLSGIPQSGTSPRAPRRPRDARGVRGRAVPLLRDVVELIARPARPGLRPPRQGADRLRRPVLRRSRLGTGHALRSRRRPAGQALGRNPSPVCESGSGKLRLGQRRSAARNRRRDPRPRHRARTSRGFVAGSRSAAVRGSGARDAAGRARYSVLRGGANRARPSRRSRSKASMRTPCTPRSIPSSAR